MALLGKQLEVQPPGGRRLAGPLATPGPHFSVADITDASSLARVRAHKAQVKAAAKGSKAAVAGRLLISLLGNTGLGVRRLAPR